MESAPATLPFRVEPFTPRTSDAAIEDLRERLTRTRFPDALPGTGWTYGADLETMRALRDHWLAFDWRAREAELAGWPHFRAPDLGLHFIHARGAGPRPFPLVVTHGWPGSFIELLALIPLLTNPADPADAFDVVVPSLPGYGYSDRPTAPGMDIFRTAELWHALMIGLGHGRYGAQGGDMGAGVSTALALRHPEAVTAIHLNYIPGSYRPAGTPSAAEKPFLDACDEWWTTHGAYAHVQRNEPQTLAFALNDSPMGLAAWLVTKFRDWADCDGILEKRFTMDEIVTHLSLYWFTETIGSSCRRYLDNARAPLHFRPGERVEVPCGIARFPLEAPFPPREWVERGYRVTRWTEMPRGGHFAAHEEPELLAEDIRAFFRPYRD